ncbi:hypothetical protein [Enteractinococcus helveticum]|nr:hypothetical protein [Enteractinococcus helveticum]
MWGFQPNFRIDLEMTANRALQDIGVQVAPTALLIGFEEEPGGFPICIEPERTEVVSELFSTALADGEDLYNTHKYRNFWNSHAGLNTRFHSDLLDDCRASVIANILNSHPVHEFHRWFVGHSASVGRYRVFPVIGVIRNRWDSLPALTKRHEEPRAKSKLSLHEAVVTEVLQSATFSLSIFEEPESIRHHDKEQIIQRAADAFVHTFVYFNGDPFGRELVSKLNAVSAQPYEGRTGVGTMLLASAENYTMEMAFENSIPLSQTRALRKALEMTDSRLGNFQVG